MFVEFGSVAFSNFSCLPQILRVPLMGSAPTRRPSWKTPLLSYSSKRVFLLGDVGPFPAIPLKPVFRQRSSFPMVTPLLPKQVIGDWVLNCFPLLPLVAGGTPLSVYCSPSSGRDCFPHPMHRVLGIGSSLILQSLGADVA